MAPELTTLLHEPCACGSFIEFDVGRRKYDHPALIVAAVQLHQQTAQHRLWADGDGFRQWADEAWRKGIW